jgi:iron complex transport system substrate-binding protein
VEYHKSYKVVTVPRPSDGQRAESYVLVQCGAPAPAVEGKLASAPVITIPIKSLFSSSSSHMPLLVDLGHVNVLAGIGQARYVTTQPVIDWIRQGHVTEYAPNSVIDTELVISKAPAMLMSSGGFSEAYSIIRKAGIPIVANAEWLEPSGLGRAEWVKYMALYLNEEGKAQRSFAAIRDRYMMLVERTRGIPVKDRPVVMTGAAYRGLFGAAGGRSYVAKMISDAGGAYVWAENQDTGVVSIDIELQIARASDADIWINGGDWTSLKSMVMEERRYSAFKAFQTGNVWLYNRITNEGGGNDYWSRGITRPDLILADMIKIFHSELMPDHEFMWYKQVPRE